MSLDACIADQIAKGALGAEQGAYIKGVYEKLQAKYRAQFGDATADALASGQALHAAEMALKKKKQRAFLQIAAQRRALDAMGQFRGRAGKWDFGRAAAALLVRDERAPYRNVEYRERAIRQGALGRMADLIEHHARNIVGEIRDKAGLLDLAREAFGEKSGNANAEAFARSWGDVADELRMRANAAGASIGKLERWGLPQSHDSFAVRTAGFEAWRAAEMPRLDRERMIDRDTDQPFDDAGLGGLMRKVYDTIVSEGWAGREEGEGGGPGSIANRHGEHRVLIYKDAESWLGSHAQFGGTASVYDAMMGHVHAMSRDIALMEGLGPNPAATVRWLKDVVTKKAMTEEGAGSEAEDAAFKATQRIQRLYDALTGANRRPESKRLAMWGESLRTYQVTTKLGSAALSTTSDVATGALTRAYNGLPMAEIATGYVRYLNPLNVEDRMQAARMGFIAEQAGTSLSGTARFMAEEMSGEVVRRLADGTTRLSGLNAITEAGRMTHGMGTISHITRERGKAFDALDDGFRGMFERYGIGADAWDAIRATPTVEENGAPWIKPERFENTQLRDQLMEMIYQEMDVAVPTSGVEIRAMLDRVAPKGTMMGEVIRTGFQFKAFPLTLMMIQWQRAMARDDNFDRLAAFGMFFGASALAGAFSLQMKEVSKGRNPRPIMTPSFLLEAIAQGGGAGIYGDFVRSSQNRFGAGPGEAVMGPAFQTVKAVATPLVANVGALLTGGQTHVARDLASLAKSETPIAGSLWYTRLAYERAALDTWRRAADPMAGQAFARMERKYRQDYNQSYWWAPGHDAPTEAPQLGNLLDPAPPPKPASRRAGW